MAFFDKQGSATQAASGPAIFAQDVSKVFGAETAVSDLTLELPPGKILGAIGPSGCGKTTTLRMLLGIYAPTKGVISVMGKEPHRFDGKSKTKMGYMPQLFVLYPQLTVWENLNFAASIYGMSPFTRGKRLNQVLEFVELDKHKHKLARNISGGMQRRLALAATLVHDPQYIFLDEPTAGIDPMLRRKFWDHFRQLRDQGRTLFVTTQYVGEAAYCDLVAVMTHGRMLMLDTPENLRQRAFGGDIVRVSTDSPLSRQDMAELQAMPFMQKPAKTESFGAYRFVVDDAATAMPALMEWFKARQIAISAIEEFKPEFDDVFIEIVKGAKATTPEVGA